MPTVMITGANRGLGLEFTRQYAADGWTVIATCRNPIGLGELATVPGEIEVHGLDVTQDISLDRFKRDLGARKIDLLINNAGIYGQRGGGAENTDYDDWEKVLRANTLAPLRVASGMLEHLAQGDGGVIATISSMLGSISEAGTSDGGSFAYRSSKAAVNMVMKVLAEDVRARNVAVVLLSPGWVQTDMGGANARLTPEQSVTGMRRVLEGAGMAETGRFFAWDGAELPW